MVKTALSFLLLLSSLSCVYSPPEEMTHVDPNSIPPNIVNQTLDLDKDTLLIWAKTRYNFNFQSDKQTIWGIKLDYLGQSLTFEGPSGYFEIDPEGHAEGTYNVKMQLYTRTGTGSLADINGREAYVFTKEWVLIIIDPVMPEALITHTTIENGFLTIHWKKCDKPYFHSYEILIHDSSLYLDYSRRFYDAGITSLTDSFFIGGKVDITLFLYYYPRADNVYHAQTNYTYRYPVTLKFKEHHDSLTVFWDKIPFNHNVYLNGISLGQDSFYTIKSPGLGSPLQYEIDIDPVKYSWQKYHVYGYHTPGEKTDMEFSKMEYIPEINAYFCKSSMDFSKYDGTTFSRLCKVSYSWDYSDDLTIGVSPDKSKVYTTILQDIVQMMTPGLQVITRQKFGPSINGDKKFSQMRIINDSLMFIAYNSSLATYDFNKRIVINSVNLNSSNGAPFHISISKDLRYIANCGQGILRVFRINSPADIVQIYETTGNFLECIFDPVNTDNLLVVTYEQDYILRCTDMETIFTIPDRIKGMAVNFDPVTNNLLFVSAMFNTITVYNYEQDTIRFKCNQHGFYSEFYLANNNIFHAGGYHVNINSYEK